MYVKSEGNLIEIKCFVICTDLLLPLMVIFSYFEIQIFMLLNWNPNPPIFWPDCHPWFYYWKCSALSAKRTDRKQTKKFQGQGKKVNQF